MTYNAKTIENFAKDLPNSLKRLEDIQFRALVVSASLTTAEAKAHMSHGVARRIRFVIRCIYQIFEILPPNALKPLDRREGLIDLGIYIHAFLLNVSGLLDDLAWVFVYESPRAAEFAAQPIQVGLMRNGIKNILPVAVARHINEPGFKAWHSEYTKTYRDAVAHRIPPYVPDRILSKADEVEFERLSKEMDQIRGNKAPDWDRIRALWTAQSDLGQPSMMMTHGLEGVGRPIFYHAQCLCDAMTVIKLLEISFAELAPRKESNSVADGLHLD